MNPTHLRSAFLMVSGLVALTGTAFGQANQSMVSDSSATLVNAAENPFNEAVALHDGGHVDEAIALYKKLLKADNKQAGVYANLGLAYVQTGKTDDAIEAYQKAVDLGTDDTDAGYNLGTLYYQKKKYKDAAKTFDAVLAQSSSEHNAPTYLNLGNTQLALKNYDAAIAAYENAAKADPKAAEPYYNLGLVYTRLKETGKVVDSFLQYVDHAPEATDAPQVKEWIVVLGKDTAR